MKSFLKIILSILVILTIFLMIPTTWLFHQNLLLYYKLPNCFFSLSKVTAKQLVFENLLIDINPLVKTKRLNINLDTFSPFYKPSIKSIEIHGLQLVPNAKNKPVEKKSLYDQLNELHHFLKPFKTPVPNIIIKDSELNMTPVFKHPLKFSFEATQVDLKKLILNSTFFLLDYRVSVHGNLNLSSMSLNSKINFHGEKKPLTNISIDLNFLNPNSIKVSFRCLQSDYGVEVSGQLNLLYDKEEKSYLFNKSAIIFQISSQEIFHQVLKKQNLSISLKPTIKASIKGSPNDFHIHLNLLNSLQDKRTITLNGAVISGKIENLLHLLTNSEGFHFQNQLKLRDVSVIKDQLEIKDINSSINFSSTESFHQSSYTLNVDTFSFDIFSFKNGKIKFRLPNLEECIIEKAQANWCNGEVLFHNLTLNKALQSRKLDIFYDHIQLEEILKLFKNPNTEAKGNLYGRMTVFLSNGLPTIKQGFLYSTPGIFPLK